MIHLRTLGGLDLSGPDGTDTRAVLSQPKRAALLTYLTLANPGGLERRDKLLALFWPEADTTRARTALRQALHFLRRCLGDELIRTVGTEEVGVDQARMWCDALAFEQSLAVGNERGALELYRGDLLSGFHAGAGHDWEEWLEHKRTRLRGRAAEAAWAVSARDEAAGNLVGAVHWAREAARWSPEGEIAIRRLIALLDRAGDVTGAVRAYEAYTRRVQTEYGLIPSPETRALMEAILNRQRSAPIEG